MFYITVLTVFTLLATLPAFSPDLAQDNDDIIDAITATSTGYIYQNLLSPNETLQAEVTIYDCTDIESIGSYSYETLELVDPEAGLREKVAEQLISCGGLGTFGLQVLRWSDDSQSLYYTDSREGVPDGYTSNSLRTIYRATVEPLQIESFRQAVFSPTGEWLAGHKEASIVLHSVDGIQQVEFPFMLPDLILADLVWLPDSNGVLVILADQIFLSTKSAVVLIDVSSLSQSLLYNSHP